MRTRKKRAPKNDRLMRRSRRRLWFVYGGVCVLFVMLIGRIMYIQYTSGERYEKKVLSQMRYDSQIIPYQRGNITDANGTILASSIDVYNVILDCKRLNDNKEKIDSTIRMLSMSFPQIEEQTIRDALRDKANSQYVKLAKRVSYKDMQAFSDLMTGEDTKDSIEGVWFEKEFIREYPYGSLAASTIGFASGDGNGAIGLESYYNTTLNGTNGRSYGYVNTDNDLERSVKEAVNGYNLVTTLDANIQSIVETEIKNFNERLAGEAGNGMDGSLNTAALVMNPKTGAILAMADYPTFDLNNPRDLSGQFTPEQIDAMTEDEQMDALNRLWQNFTISHTYEPGSTFKPFTIACGLETGKMSGGETYFCDGVERIGEYEIHCVNRNGHGQESVSDALADSCNDALMQMSYAIGGSNFYDYQRLFGFGQRTNVDTTGEARTDALIYSKKELEGRTNLATNSFGQSFNVTMIQLASAFCSLVNGGQMYQPYIVDSITDEAGNVIEKMTPTVQKQTLSKETSEQMKGYLKTVVESGTGTIAGVEGYSIGGKTGTAEKAPRTKSNYLVSFIGFAPVEDPEVLVYVVVDEPNVLDQAHSSYAQEITHNIFAQILPYLNVDSTGPVEASELFGTSENTEESEMIEEPQ